MLTKAEIEAARENIKAVILENDYGKWIANGKQQTIALEALAALYETALKATPESLVGKRVRIKKTEQWYDEARNLGKITNLNPSGHYEVAFDFGGSWPFDRGDFELLEDSDADKS